MVNKIPLARGLGSSAAATVGGLLAGNSLLGDALSQADILRLATSIEGHPDNAAPALLGGFVASAVVGESGDAVEAIRFDVPRGIRAVIFVPDLRLSTSDMRKVLPAKVPRADAVANLGRVAIGVAGMATGRRDILRFLTEDRLHEPYRATVYPQLTRLVGDARAAGAIGACLSGAGSAILAFTDTVSGVARIESAFRAAAADTDLPGRVEVVAPRNAGAKVLPRADAGFRVDGPRTLSAWMGSGDSSRRWPTRSWACSAGWSRRSARRSGACSPSSRRSCPDHGS